MSIIGKKVKVSVMKLDDKGQAIEGETENFEGVVLDKFMNVFPTKDGIPMQCDNYLIQKNDNTVENCHPSFISEILN